MVYYVCEFGKDVYVETIIKLASEYWLLVKIVKKKIVSCADRRAPERGVGESEHGRGRAGHVGSGTGELAASGSDVVGSSS